MSIKVVFHIDELSKWSLLLKNVQNLTKVVDVKNSLIEILANSEAVGFYAGSALNSDRTLMQDLSRTGVLFVACNNALKGMGIQREVLPQFVEVVPVGVLELIEKQSQGYAYIKP
jgi:intracellular sulfur oxidation DsrE/DsrF family protein